MITLDKFKRIWEYSNVLVIFDTNILLDLYRFSTTATDTILQNFNKISENIWIPGQTKKEFLHNRDAVRKEQFNKYKDLVSELKTILGKTHSNYDKKFFRYRKYDFPNIQELHSELIRHLDRINQKIDDFSIEIDNETKTNNKLLQEDKVSIFFDRLLSQKSIGNEYNTRHLIQIYLEGEYRYRLKIPPGYMDIEKDKTDETKTKKFGDLILWKQVIDKGKKHNGVVFFLTNDTKEDWWSLETKTPRQELLEEYFEETGTNNIYILTLKDFINHISVINEISSTKALIEINANYHVINLLNEHKENFEALVLEDFEDNIAYDVLQLINSNIEFEVENLTNIFVNKWEVTDSYVEFEGTNDCLFRVSLNFDLSADMELRDKSYVGIVEVNLEIITTISTKLEYNQDYPQLEFDDFEIDSTSVNNFQERFSINESELCVICLNRIGEVQYGSDLICENCAFSDSVDYCSKCGTAFERGEMSGAFCSDCDD